MHDIKQVIQGVGELTRIHVELTRLAASIRYSTSAGAGNRLRRQPSSMPSSRNYTIAEARPASCIG